MDQNWTDENEKKDTEQKISETINGGITVTEAGDARNESGVPMSEEKKSSVGSSVRYTASSFNLGSFSTTGKDDSEKKETSSGYKGSSDSVWEPAGAKSTSDIFSSDLWTSSRKSESSKYFWEEKKNESAFEKDGLKTESQGSQKEALVGKMDLQEESKAEQPVDSESRAPADSKTRDSVDSENTLSDGTVSGQIGMINGEPPKNTFSDKSKEEKEKKKKKKLLIIGGIVLALFLVGAGVGLYFLLRDDGSAISATELDNTLTLARRYMESGDFDRALDLVESILIRDADEKDALALMDEIINRKNQSAEGGGSGTGTNINVTGLSPEELAALQSSIDMANQNNAAINELLRKQNSSSSAEALGAQLAAAEKQRQEDIAKEKAAAEAAEKQRQEEVARQKAEAEKKAAEEKARAERDAALKQQMAKVEDKISLGKAAVGSGEYDTAIKHFDEARDILPEEQKAFSAQQMSTAAESLITASESVTSQDAKKKTADAAYDFATTALQYDPKDAGSHYVYGKNAVEKGDKNTALNEFTISCIIMSWEKFNTLWENIVKLELLLKLAENLTVSLIKPSII